MNKKKEYNAADETQIEKIEISNKTQRDQELEDIKTLLDTPAGVRFFRRLLVEGKIFSTTFTGNSSTFYLEGHRNLALKFFSDICEARPDKIALLMIDKPE